MRPKRNIFTNNIKINNTLVGVTTGGTGNGYTSETVTLDTDTSNGSVSIPIDGSTTLIKFENFTYSNGGNQYETLNGSIFNVETATPTLAIYSGSSNLDLMTITLGNKTGTSMPINLSGQNISAQIAPDAEYTTLRIDTPLYPYLNASFVTVEGEHAIKIEGEYPGDPFGFLDGSGGAVTPFIVGNINTRVQFSFIESVENSGTGIKWFFEFGGYILSSGGDNSITFKLPQKVIKDPDGAAITSDLETFFLEEDSIFQNDTENFISLNDPVNLLDFSLGGSDGTTLTSITNYIVT